jgi:hypothetical protein
MKEQTISELKSDLDKMKLKMARELRKSGSYDVTEEFPSDITSACVVGKKEDYLKMKEYLATTKLNLRNLISRFRQVSAAVI